MRSRDVLYGAPRAVLRAQKLLVGESGAVTDFCSCSQTDDRLVPIFAIVFPPADHAPRPTPRSRCRAAGPAWNGSKPDPSTAALSPSETPRRRTAKPTNRGKRQ
ncbi:unnamed protein product [Gadus morhua 'NCC']